MFEIPASSKLQYKVIVLPFSKYVVYRTKTYWIISTERVEWRTRRISEASELRFVTTNVTSVI